MYQFGGGPAGGSHPPPQYSQPAALNGGQYPPFQPTQRYGQPQHMPMQQVAYHISPQTAHSPISPYPNFSHGQPGQTQSSQFYGTNQQRFVAGNSSYSGASPQVNSQPGGYTSSAVAPMNRHFAPFEPQTAGPQFSHGAQRQTELPASKVFANKSSESCYNCGAPDHWAQDCPEPRRAIPAGQANRPQKRQKTHGGVIATNQHVTQHQKPSLQRGWSDPAVAQRSFSTPGYVSNSQTSPLSDNRPWVNQHYQKPQMHSVSSNTGASSSWTQQMPKQGPFASKSLGPSGGSSWSQPQNYQPIYQPHISDQVNQNHPSASPSISTDASMSWKYQPSSPRHDAPLIATTGEQTAFERSQAQSENHMVTQATHWSAQHLPTPAPSSVDSQIPSPATSNPNFQVEYNAQQTPSCTDSPGNRKDSASSVQKTNLGSQAQQAESVTNLFTELAQTATPRPTSPPELAPPSEKIKQTEDELEAIYGLDFSDVLFEQDINVSNPALPVPQPLSSSMNKLDADNPKPVEDRSTTGTSLSTYIRDLRDEEFLKNVQESPEWRLLKDDPIFAKIKANTTTVTFDELIERRHQLMNTSEIANSETESDAGSGQQQETDEERLAREQEERLAALGVTGQAKPVTSSSSEAACVEISSPAKNLELPRALGDPGWKVYERGRAVERPSIGHESSTSATKNRRSISSTDQTPQELSQGRHLGTFSPEINASAQQSYRKRTYSETSEEIDGTPRRQDSDRKQGKPRFKQPKVAAAYGRRW